MSTGGVFRLIANDGKQDRMLMATEMLRDRLDQVVRQRRAEGQDPTPTLWDVEKTHVLFMNAHFKPFVAFGFEYNKVNASAGTVTLGSQVQFSIPQFGDFFSDMVLHLVLSAPQITATAVETGQDLPAIRWCDYPGLRVLKKTSIDVNGNPLDEYTSDAAVMYHHFCVPPNKRPAWDRCLGQQETYKGYLGRDSATASGPESHRVYVDITDGAQTPKASQTGLSMFIPLLFWFNKDPRLAIPSVAIPHGQRFVNFTLAERDELVGLVKRGNFAANYSVTTPSVTTCNLYINNIFVNPEIHKIYIKRIGFSLIRVHRQQTSVITKSSENILLQSLKWPVETMFVGLRPVANKTAVPVVGTSGVDDPTAEDNERSLRDWYKFTQETLTEYKMPNVLSRGTTVDTTSGEVKTFTHPSVYAQKSTKTIDSITISAFSVEMYKQLPADFFNAYIPYTYGGHNVMAPSDKGALMINFNLYPGSYQPSGHFNVSRAREFYIEITSSVASSANPAELIVVAQAINFLLISDGSAVLRYTT